MALDEPTDSDERQQEDGFELVIDKDLLSQLGGAVEIDFYESPYFIGKGFRIRPTQAQPATGCC